MTADKTTTVVVREPFQVVHDGEVHLAGETVEVPEALAQFWIRSDWVDEVQTKMTRGARR